MVRRLAEINIHPYPNNTKITTAKTTTKTKITLIILLIMKVVVKVVIVVVVVVVVVMIIIILYIQNYLLVTIEATKCRHPMYMLELTNPDEINNPWRGLANMSMMPVVVITVVIPDELIPSSNA